MVALFQCLLRQPFPAVRTIDSLGGLKSGVEVATLNSKIEPCVFVLNEVQGNLRKSCQKGFLATQEWITSGNPFCCKYAMILWPNKVEVRMICNISS